MIIFKKADKLSTYLQQQKNRNHTIGFVPTMGALHKGHLSLIELSKTENSLTVCSIFVNPTQFNNADDFKHYPVTVEKDIELLIKAGCSVLFLPDKEEIYPPGYKVRPYELGEVETILEGHYRPGHFQGVCQVVERLFQIVNPSRVYFGQKDYQQCIVIERLLQLINKEKEITLKVAPTQREENGLALSSRNLRLSGSEREEATAIIKALNFIKNHLPHQPVAKLKEEALQQLQQKGFTVDYVEIADAKTLKPATDIHPGLIALIAAGLGKVRLIDNLLLN
jgi:pantoate--beta-alanine ligase